MRGLDKPAGVQYTSVQHIQAVGLCSLWVVVSQACESERKVDQEPRKEVQFEEDFA